MKEDFRKHAPQPLAPVPFEIPKPYETELDNGLKIVVFEEDKLPLVSFRLLFFAGDADDPKDQIGITSAIASMLNEGTKERSSRELADEIERLGASISASSSSDSTVISASTLTLYKSEILALMAEMVLFPDFPENELDLYRQNAIEGLKLQRSQPSFLANEQIAKILYGSHPYGIYSPSPADVEKMTREMLLDHHLKTFVPNNAMLIAVGDVNRDEFVKEAADVFGGWSQGEISYANFEKAPGRNSRTLTIVDRPGSAQSNIVLGNLAIDRNHPDYFPVLVMNQILGAGASSRLFMNLREEKGYTYGAYSRFDAKKRGGEFEATAEVRTPVTGESLKEFFYEINRIRDEKVIEAELQDAKNFLTGVFPIRAETQEGLTNMIVSQKLYDLPDDYLQTYRDNVQKVSVEDVARAANEYIKPGEIAIVIVGDGEEVLEQAQAYADSVEIFDTDGKPRDLSAYGKQSSAAAADVNGKWNLILEFQGQKIPVSMSLDQTNGAVSGKIDSMLGEGEISDGKISGNKFTATAGLSFQGQKLELSIGGIIDGDSIEGSLNAPMIPTPLNFNGKREK